MSVALQGAVIIEDDGTFMTYQCKCESCGTLQSGTTHTSSPKFATMCSSFMCYSCQKTQEVKIRGSNKAS